jgi:hypothetical protein
MREKTPREQVELAVMSWLNDNKMYGVSKVFDFGKLGLLWIYWHRKWMTRWLEVEQPPTDVVRLLKGA